MLLTSNQELLVVTPALVLAVMLSDQGLARDLSLPIVLFAVTGWVANEFFGVSWPGSSYTAANVWLLAAFRIVGVSEGPCAFASRSARCGMEPL